MIDVLYQQSWSERVLLWRNPTSAFSLNQNEPTTNKLSMLVGHLAVRQHLGEGFAHDLGGLLQLHRLELDSHRPGLGRQDLTVAVPVHADRHHCRDVLVGAAPAAHQVDAVDVVTCVKISDTEARGIARSSEAPLRPAWSTRRTNP